MQVLSSVWKRIHSASHPPLPLLAVVKVAGQKQSTSTSEPRSEFRFIVSISIFATVNWKPNTGIYKEIGLFPSWLWKPKNIMSPCVVYDIHSKGHQMMSWSKPVVLISMFTASVIKKVASKCQYALIIKLPTGNILKPLHSCIWLFPYSLSSWSLDSAFHYKASSPLGNFYT